MNECKYCDKRLSTKRALQRHLNICKERECIIQKEQYDTQIQTLKEIHEKEIQSLKEKIEKLENQIFEIAKQPKTTNHNNQRIKITNQLAVYDLTQEKVIDVLNKHFSNEVFLDGPTAIVDLVRNEIVIDPDTGKPKLIITDSSRLNGKYLTETKKVEIDLGCEKTYNILKNPLLDANDKKFSELTEQIVDTRTGRIKDEERDGYKRKSDLHEKNEKMVKSKNHFINKLFVKDNK
jgi:hypothetical protein